ncbi:MAG: thioredoxin family protein [Cyclobacteriaceae bacterium]
MKSFLLFVMVSSSLMFAADKLNVDDADFDTAIQFKGESWKKITSQAKEENKLIFIDVYATWCGPCKVLKKTTFTDAELGDYFNANFVNAAFDAEKGEGKRLAEEFKVTAYPTMLFVDSDGTVIKRLVGYHNANQLLRKAKEVAKQFIRESE